MASRSAKMPKMKKTKEHLYNAEGAPEAGEAMDETPGFKKGGKTHKKHAKRKHGGHVEGEKEKHRADRKPRGHEHHKHGGHVKHHEEKHMEHHKRASGGRTPYTSGHSTSEPSEAGKTNTGHEGQRPG